MEQCGDPQIHYILHSVLLTDKKKQLIGTWINYYMVLLISKQELPTSNKQVAESHVNIVSTFFSDKEHFIQLIYRGDTTALKNARPLHSVMHTANMSNKPKNKYRFTAKVNQSSLGWGNAYPEITPPSMLGENLPGCMLQPCRRHHKKVSVLRPLQDRPRTEPSRTRMDNLHRR